MATSTPIPPDPHPANRKCQIVTNHQDLARRNNRMFPNERRNRDPTQIHPRLRFDKERISRSDRHPGRQ
jgi:hypothetical protein